MVDRCNRTLGSWRGCMPTLLVIDDEPTILESIRMAVDGRDATVVTAASGAEGLEKLAQCQPDVVMLDINMPDLSGLDLAGQDRGARNPARAGEFGYGMNNQATFEL